MNPSSVLVTGANRGIGLALVRRLVANVPPPRVIIASCRRPEAADELNQLASKNEGVKVVVVKMDVSDEASIVAAFEETKRLCPEGLNLLVNNAGGVPAKDNPEQFSFDTMTECFKVNSVGPMIVSRTFHPLLAKAAAADGPMSASKSAIIMISSVFGSLELLSGRWPFPIYAYNASKAALNMIAKSLAFEFEPDGILVTSVHPGWVRTETGGENGELSPEESADNLVALMAVVESGKFYGHDFLKTGKYLPW